MLKSGFVVPLLLNDCWLSANVGDVSAFSAFPAAAAFMVGSLLGLLCISNGFPCELSSTSPPACSVVSPKLC